MRKSLRLLVLTGIGFLSVGISPAESNDLWYKDQPWTNSSNFQESNPLFELEGNKREKVVKRVLEKYLQEKLKEESKEIYDSIKDRYDIVEKTEKIGRQIRDDYLTVKVGDVPIQENIEEITEPKEKGKRYFIARPNLDGINIKARENEHFCLDGKIDISGADISIKPKFNLPIPFIGRLPLPMFDFEYSWDSGYEVGFRYNFRF